MVGLCGFITEDLCYLSQIEPRAASML